MKSNKQPSTLIKILIWVVVLFVGNGLLVGIAMGGVALGALPSILMFIAECWVAKTLCKKYSDFVEQNNSTGNEGGKYTVRFFTNNYMISSLTYNEGETLRDIPQMPELVLIDNVRHHFKGWTPVLNYTVTKSQDYIADYRPEVGSTMEE